MPYYVYILTNKNKTTFYTGVTNNLSRRIYEHKEGVAKSFTRKFHLKFLVYYEVYEDVLIAIAREKLIKKWRREIKFEKILEINPSWEDLYFKL